MYYEKGNILLGGEKFAEAAEEYKACLKINPKFNLAS